MADRAFHLKVFTPAGLVLDERTDSVKVPTVDGEIGILPLHTRYTGLIGQGTLEFTGEKGVQKLFLEGGIIQCAGSSLTILADYVSNCVSGDVSNIASQ